MAELGFPSWLRTALDDREPGPAVPFVDAPDEPRDSIAAGEIRVARAMSEEPIRPRLVLVLEVFSNPAPWANVCLLSELVEAAGEKDVRALREETGLTFEVLVETDVVGPVFLAQLGPSLRAVSKPFLKGIQACLRGESADFAERLGLPVRDEREARWRFKTEEISGMHLLAHDCFEHLIHASTDDYVADVILDPVLFQAGADRTSRLVLLALDKIDRAGWGRPDLVWELPVVHSVKYWAIQLGPDEIRAFEPVWTLCLDGAREIAESDYGMATVGAASGVSLLDHELARRGLEGQRTLRVVTTVDNVELGLASRILRLHVPGVGLLQVEREFVDPVAVS